MRIYINAQFYDGTHRTRLLSVGMVSEIGQFYRIAENPGAIEHARKDSWMREHVLTRLPYDEEGRDWLWNPDHPDYEYVLSPESIGDDMMDFVDSHTDPEFWAWHGSYAYVCIRHLLGKVNELPVGFPAWCGELAAEWHAAGQPELPPRGKQGHHAMELARWAMQVDELLKNSEF